MSTTPPEQTTTPLAWMPVPGNAKAFVKPRVNVGRPLPSTDSIAGRSANGL